MEKKDILFKLHRKDGSVTEFTKEVITYGDNEMIEWIVQQYAEVNKCGCSAHYNGKQISIFGSIHS